MTKTYCAKFTDEEIEFLLELARLRGTTPEMLLRELVRDVFRLVFGGRKRALTTADRAKVEAWLIKWKGNLSAIARASGKERIQVRRWLKYHGLDANAHPAVTGRPVSIAAGRDEAVRRTRK